jgi:hypothetical protein
MTEDIPIRNRGRYLFASCLRCGRHLERGVITRDEFINKMLDEIAHAKEVYPEAVPCLWKATPACIREDFAARLRATLLPGFSRGRLRWLDEHD